MPEPSPVDGPVEDVLIARLREIVREEITKALTGSPWGPIRVVKHPQGEEDP